MRSGTSRQPIASWGRIAVNEQSAIPLWWRDDPPPFLPGRSSLAFGLGRSYGDSCLNDAGTLLLARGLDRFISFDPTTGFLACEAGVSLAEITAVLAPRGFFPAVVPGTKHVTVGGAIANDIHGKNHHRAGTFGRHVERFELMRSDGSRRTCSRSENPDLFAATVGGLGLTGLITWAELRLRTVPSEAIDSETIPFDDLDAFFDLSAQSDGTHEYTVAWVDCLARGRHLGRGLLFRGNHAPASAGLRWRRKRPVTLPFDLPGFMLNRISVAAFNGLYRSAGRLGARRRLIHHDPFFFPLDRVERWNRMYGRRGLLQFQCVVPFAVGNAAIRRLMDAIAASGQGSFLAVLKTFGDAQSPGLLSFPRRGVTLALDFPRRGERTVELFRTLEKLVLDAGGAMYPAKDALMSPAMFRASYPRLAEFEPHVDPGFSSSFWRRVHPIERPA